MEKKLEDLNLKPALVELLKSQGFRTAEDFAEMSAVDILRLPNIAGAHWKSLCLALGKHHPRLES